MCLERIEHEYMSYDDRGQASKGRQHTQSQEIEVQREKPSSDHHRDIQSLFANDWSPPSIYGQ